MLSNTMASKKSEYQNRRRAEAEAIAKSFTVTRKQIPPLSPEKNKGKGETSGEFSKRRADISRGKKPVLVDEASGEDDGAVMVPKEVKKSTKKTKKKKHTKEELYEIFFSMDFSGTRYPHPETLKKLGISRDVAFLLEMCNLDTFMSYSFEAYKDETCQFLASLEVHVYEDNEEAEADCQNAEELGYITFEVNNKSCRLSISQLDTLFGFSSGTGTYREVDKDELQLLWEIIGDKAKYQSSRSKSAQIRNPAIRYVHKALASTIFARKVTGNVNDSEIQMLDIALKDLLNSSHGDNTFVGDKFDTGVSMVLLDQMMCYRDWAVRLHGMGKKGELTIGGVVTPILHAAEIDPISNPYAPKWLDITNLIKQRFLDSERVRGGFLYKFTHPVVGEAQIILPNTPLTKIRLGENIDFRPPVESLYNPTEEPIREDPMDTEEDPEQEPECYYFDDTVPAKTLKEANKRNSLLQKWNKWQDKQIKSLKSKMRDLANQIKGNKDPIKTSGLNVLRRSGSLSIGPTRSVPMEPARASSFEPRRSVPVAPAKGLTYERRHQKKLAASTGVDRADSSTPLSPPRTGYTLESMAAYTDSLFTNP